SVCGAPAPRAGRVSQVALQRRLLNSASSGRRLTRDRLTFGCTRTEPANFANWATERRVAHVRALGAEHENVLANLGELDVVVEAPESLRGAHVRCGARRPLWRFR